MNKEIRSIDSEIRTLHDSRIIEGYALKFDVESKDLGGFVEVIDRNALDGVLDKSDVLALYNHDNSRVLARNSYGTGSLSLEVDEIGLKYRFEAPDTSDGNDLLYHVRSGNLRNSSFCFTLPSNRSGERWENNRKNRIITKFDRLWDVSPVWSPAYLDTTVAVRSLNEVLLEDQKEQEAIEIRKAEQEFLNEYYNQLKNEVDSLKK